MNGDFERNVPGGRGSEHDGRVTDGRESGDRHMRVSIERMSDGHVPEGQRPDDRMVGDRVSDEHVSGDRGFGSRAHDGHHTHVSDRRAPDDRGPRKDRGPRENMPRMAIADAEAATPRVSATAPRANAAATVPRTGTASDTAMESWILHAMDAREAAAGADTLANATDMTAITGADTAARMNAITNAAERMSADAAAAGAPASAAQADVSMMAMRRERAIANAVERGLPRRVTLLSTLTRMRGTLRLCDLFFGAWDCVAAALVMTAVAWLWPFMRLLADARRIAAQPGMAYALAFLAAPFLYEATLLLVRWREHERGTDGLLRVMRWSFVRLCALRMLVVGAAASMLIVAYGCVANAVLADAALTQAGAGAGGAGGGLSMMSLLGVAFSALFLFGIAQLAADMWLRWPWSMAVAPVAWLALCGMMIALGNRIVPLLTRIPPMVAVAAAVTLGIAWLLALSRFVRRSPAAVA